MRRRTQAENDLFLQIPARREAREPCCFLYARVSTAEQADAGSSLQAQEDHGRRFCADQGYADPQVRIEVESAGEEKHERRIEMKRILDEIQTGDVLVCRDLSRWSRDQVFALQSLRQLKAKGVTVRFWTQPFLDVLAGASAAPVDLTGIIAWAAENERRMIVDRTVNNRRRLRARGDFVEGRPPFGYVNRNRRLVIVPERAAIVRRIFDDFLNGCSMRQLAIRLRVEYPNFDGGLRGTRIMLWSAHMVKMILRNPIYTGVTKTTKMGRLPRDPQNDGQWLQTHEPIISSVVFLQAASALEQQRHAIRSHQGPSKTAHFLLKHVAVCSVCGHSIRPFRNKLFTEDRRDRYQCSKYHEPRKYRDRTRCANGKSTARKSADASAEAQILKRLDEMVEVLSRHSRPARPAPPDWGKLASALADKRARVVRMVMDGLITAEQAAQPLAELRKEETALEVRRREFEREQAADTEDARKEAFAKLTSYRELYNNLNIADRRELFFELAESVKITPAREVLITWRPLPAIAASSATVKTSVSR